MSGMYRIKNADFADAESVFRIINAAYAIELGNEGVSFTNCNRLETPTDKFLLDGYNEQRIIKAENSLGDIVGVMYYDVSVDYVHFGPFAVDPALKGRGIGKLLLDELFKRAYEYKVKYVEIKVINWRTDVIPMYEKIGFIKICEIPHPEPAKTTRPSTLITYRKTLTLPQPPQSITSSSVPMPILVAPQPPAVFKQTTKSPWTSINNMLIQNRCWLCEQVFPRGKQKKVFQVSDLLDYYTARLKAETEGIHSTSSNEGTATDAMGVEEELPVESKVDESLERTTNNERTTEKDIEEQGSLPLLISRNFRECYESFARIVHEDPTGTKNRMRTEFVENDIEVWMSGLVCGISNDCRHDLSLFIKPKTSSSTTGVAGGKPTNSFGGLLGSGKDKDGKDCPPGCGCDNPWPFLA